MHKTFIMSLYSVFFVLSFASLPWSLAGEKVVTVPAIFVFGDSLADVGNNNYLKTKTAKANFPFNGIDFPGSIPTGRFSNGYNDIDWLAKSVGYEQSPPAYLSLTNGTQMLHGVNFASGGSGILDSTGMDILTFTAQIADFEKVVEVFVKTVGKETARKILYQSLFLISAGSNDLFGYYLTLGPQNTTTNHQFVATLINKFSDHLKVLYKHGARKFGIIGISHIGCIPAMTSINPTGDCIATLNSLARTFNKAAKSQMHHLKSKLTGMKYSYGNVYDLMSQALAHPKMFGFADVKDACCGSGRFNGMGYCLPNATLCSNRNQYLFWDRFHPTQITSKNTATAMFSGSRMFATPINIKKLVSY